MAVKFTAIALMKLTGVTHNKEEIKYMVVAPPGYVLVIVPGVK